MRAYCYASGLIEFGRAMPDGALPVARGPAKVLRDFIEVRARHGYRTEIVNGRPTKIPGTETLLVPGVPEAPDQMAAVDALTAFRKWIGLTAPKGVVV
jgi:imidazoleglycerol phosphate synthase glutamine amidotransferase subunit HisH